MLKVTKTEKAPAAIGPYSQAVGFGDLLFTSGQIALDPATGEVVGYKYRRANRASYEKYFSYIRS